MPKPNSMPLVGGPCCGARVIVGDEPPRRVRMRVRTARHLDPDGAVEAIETWPTAARPGSDLPTAAYVLDTRAGVYRFEPAPL